MLLLHWSVAAGRNKLLLPVLIHALPENVLVHQERQCRQWFAHNGKWHKPVVNNHQKNAYVRLDHAVDATKDAHHLLGTDVRQTAIIAHGQGEWLNE